MGTFGAVARFWDTQMRLHLAKRKDFTAATNNGRQKQMLLKPVSQFPVILKNTGKKFT